ncbi:MAG: hypothetical protein GX548_00860 [Lentisphaerae bacterium]|nr:hypothetical protein [Lentisphaerota bacterium]
MAEEILRGRIPNGEIIEVDAGEEALVFHPPGTDAAAGTVPAAAEPAPKEKTPARRRRKKGGEA